MKTTILEQIINYDYKTNHHFRIFDTFIPTISTELELPLAEELAIVNPKKFKNFLTISYQNYFKPIPKLFNQVTTSEITLNNLKQANKLIENNLDIFGTANGLENCIDQSGLKIVKIQPVDTSEQYFNGKQVSNQIDLSDSTVRNNLETRLQDLCAPIDNPGAGQNRFTFNSTKNTKINQHFEIDLDWTNLTVTKTLIDEQSKNQPALSQQIYYLRPNRLMDQFKNIAN